MQLHHAKVHVPQGTLGLGVPFLLAHCQDQPDLVERYEFGQVVWGLDLPDRFRASEDAMVQAILRDEPDVLGLSLAPWSYRRFCRVIERVKAERPGIYIVVGGPNPSLEDETLLGQLPEIDALVSGAGERALAALLRALGEPEVDRRGERLAAIGNLLARHQGAIVGGRPERCGDERLDDYGDPLSAGLVELQPDRDELCLEWTRGCPHECAHCAWSRGDRQLRSFSPERIASDLRWAVEQGFDEVTIADAAINYDTERLRTLCGALASTAPSLRPSAFVYWPAVDEGQVELMSAVRWSRLIISLQTDDAAGLEALSRRQHDAEQLERAVRLLTPLTRPYVELLTGIPGDSAEALRGRVQYARSLGCRVILAPVRAAKGTRLRQRCLAAGAALDPRSGVVAQLPTLGTTAYRQLIGDLRDSASAPGELELWGYDFLDLDGPASADEGARRPVAAPPVALPVPEVALDEGGLPDGDIRIAPGARVFVHQAFTCCPYAALITAKIHAFFEQNGCEVTDEPDHAALEVINTCGFNADRTERAVNAIGLVRERAPETPVVVAGCLTKIEGSRVRAALRGGPPSLLLGPHEHDQFDGLFDAPRAAFGDVQVNRYMERYSAGDPRLPLYQVLVATGCLNQCRYCVIYRAKGTVRSRSIDEVVAEVERGMAQGHRDILLVADDVSVWGADRGQTVVDLFEALARLEGNVRYSVEAFEPSRFLDHLEGLCEVFATGRFSWIVLPVQSGNARVLEAMGRNYTRQGMERAIRKLRMAAPELVLTTDLIFGFAGETPEEFAETLELGQLFDYCDFNEYEPRPGTPPMLLSAEQLAERHEMVQEFRRRQGAQVDKLAFCNVDDYLQTAQDARVQGAVGDWEGLEHTVQNLDLADAPPPAASPEAESSVGPSPWVEEHAAVLQTLLEQQGGELAAGWSVTRVDREAERVVLVVDHQDAAEPLCFMVMPRDEQVHCIAFSAQYNLGLIWEKEIESRLDADQSAALDVLQRRLGLDKDQSG